MGVRTKAILWLLPLLPAQNWLYWNALIAAEQKDALCPSLSVALHWFFMVLILKLPVFPLKVFSQQQHSHLSLPALPGKCLCGCGMRAMTGSIYLAACAEKHLQLVIRVPSVCLGMCSWEWLYGSSPCMDSHSAPCRSIKSTSWVLS